MTREQAAILINQISIYTKMALGFRNPSYGKEGLTFKCNKFHYVTINLNRHDLYDIRTFKIKRGSNEQIVMGKKSDIFVEDLNQNLYDMTQK